MTTISDLYKWINSSIVNEIDVQAMPRHMGYPSWRRSKELPEGELCLDGTPHTWVARQDGVGEECSVCLTQNDGSLLEGSPTFAAEGEGNAPALGSGMDYSRTSMKETGRKLERSLLRELIYGSESKSEMQREAEMILDKLCSSNPEGSTTRRRVLADAIKQKAKFKRRTQNEFLYLPTGRKAPFNCIVAAFTVDLFVQEGDRMGSIGIERTIQRMEETLPGWGYSEAIEGENRRRMRAYLSRDYRKLRMLLGRKRREAPVDNSWSDFLDHCHEMARNATFETPLREWDGLMSWCRTQDRDVMAALLPNAKSTRDKVAFELIYPLSGLTRDELAAAIGWKGGRTDDRRVREVSTRIAEMWRAA